MPLHFSYTPMIIPGAGAGGGVIDAIEGVCDISLQVGAFVYVAGNTPGGQRIFALSSCLVDATMPAVGIVVQKPTVTTCKVATTGAFDLPVSTWPLDVGESAYVGIDGFPSTTLLTDFPEALYLQRVGTASKPRELILNIGEGVKLV